MRPTKYTHSGIFAFEKLPAGDPGEPAEGETTLEIPQDEEGLAALSDEDLDEANEGSLVSNLLAAIDSMDDVQDPEALAQLSTLVDGVKKVRTERKRREDVRAGAKAEADRLRAEIAGPDPDAAPDDAGDGEGEGDGDAAPEGKVVDAPKAEAPAPAPVAEPALAAAAAPNVTVKGPKRLNVNLGEVRRRGPQHEVAPALAITAAADVPKFRAGHQFANIREVAAAIAERAKTTPVSVSGQTSGPKVASIAREYKHTVRRDTSDAQMVDLIKSLTDQDAFADSLVAGGGWCAPSETVYSFFDITCEDGALDLPTFGVERGGIRFPTSPSYADVFTGTFDVTTNPWLWTETDDILTVTGSTNKPCVRVPCPAFVDRRLEDYGICLTAGNLSDAAFPEATEHQLGLLQTAHYHAMNQRIIATVVALSTSVVATGAANDGLAISSDLLNMIEWAAIDQRTRLGMCEGAILEVILPKWAKAVVRADYGRRNGINDPLSVTDAMINNWLDIRSVRVQWVNDWQIRVGPQPGGSLASQMYPPAVQFLIYAAGTFGLGNGPSLDLGVVRDSVLNAENDHTAAWSEEAHLVAMFGPMSRLYTVSICAAGLTGAANITTCGTAA